MDTTVVVASLVGRTGADGAWVVDSSPIQDAPVAHSRPFWQQPPPRLAGQENQPVEQVYADLIDEDGAGVVVGVEEVVGVAELASDVGTTAVVVEDVEGRADVEGWT